MFPHVPCKYLNMSKKYVLGISDVGSGNINKQSAASKAATPTIHQDSVHIRLEEKIALTGNRDGGLQNLEIHGLITLKITDEKLGRIKLGIENNDNKGIQLQVKWCHKGVLYSW